MRHLRLGVGVALLLMGVLGGSNVLAADPPPHSQAGGLRPTGPNGERIHIAPSRGLLGTPAAAHNPPPGAGSGGVGGATGSVVIGNGINYYGGPIIPLQNVVAIYWGSSQIYANGPTSGTVGTGAQDASVIGFFMRNLGGSSYYAINTTYGDNVGTGHTVQNAMTYSRSWADNQTAPANTIGGVQMEIARGLSNGTLTYDPSTVFVVFGPPGFNLGGAVGYGACAYHSYFAWNGRIVPFAVMPHDQTIPLAPGYTCSAISGSPNNDPAADIEVSILSHELEEANTDPYLNAWYDDNGQENADKCAWTFGTTYVTGNNARANINVGGKDFLVQQNWLNAEGGRCAKTYTPPPAGPTAPGAPALTAVAGNGAVDLSWTAPASDGGSAITGYSVHRSTTSGAETLLAGVGLATTYHDVAVTNGVTYWYRVSATNTIGTGPQSNEVSARPLAIAPGAPALTATPGNQVVTLTWAPPTSNGGSAITSYGIYRSTTSGTQSLVKSIGNVTIYVDTGRRNGTAYYYRVAAVNSAGTGALSNEGVATPGPEVPGIPTNLTATTSNNVGVQLKWSQPLNNGSSIVGYRVYRGDAAGGETFLTQRPKSTSWTDTGTSPGARYWYRISAVNGVGEGGQSNEVSAVAR